MTRPVLHKWQATRSGATITVTHSAGKLTSVAGLLVDKGKVIAIKTDATEYVLETAA